nr:SIR2 family protein [Solimonas terrae]
MITDFRKRLFCQLSGIRTREVDANDPLWLERIDLLLRTRSSLPESDHPTAYAATFEAVYPSPEDRRAYIDDAIRKGTPSFSHRVLASLLAIKQTPCVFTTNFDHLVEDATTVTNQLLEAAKRAPLTVAAIDNVARAELCISESRWPLLAKLHGDYQSVELKNTNDELKSQDARMQKVLTAACSRFGLVIVGYSGRDDSVMAALSGALAQPSAYPGGLFWVTRSANTLLPAVATLLSAADRAGVSVTIVESQTFDELAADIADVIELPQELTHHVFQARPEPVVRDVVLPLQERRQFPVLQCSALPILAMPSAARKIEVDSPVTTARAREILREAQVWGIVASNGREIAAYGVDADLLRAFSGLGARLAGTVELQPDKDSWARGLIYDALARALTRRRPLFARLRRKGHSLLVQSGSEGDSQEVIDRRYLQLEALRNAYPDALVGTIPDLDYPFNEGVQIRLDRVGDRWWCAFEPMTHVQFPSRESTERNSEDKPDEIAPSTIYQGDPAIDWRRERWARRYNRVWAKIISAWAKTLAGEGSPPLHAVGLKEGTGMDAVFKLSPVTAWSRPSHEHGYFLR